MKFVAKFVEIAAALAFALCVALSLRLWGLDAFASVSLAALPGVGAHLLLARIGRPVDRTPFAPADPGFDEEPDDVLLLDDPLVGLGPDSNVVRLFGESGRRGAEPGELAARIDQFLGARGQEPKPEPLPDAAQELADALAAIRQTLRR